MSTFCKSAFMQPFFPYKKSSFKQLLIRGLFLITSLYIASLQALAQTPAIRPSVGLVLSGGGSHGIAHLGVLKVMEEAGLRPDYITGVSMGSIIGGMYSIGYSTDSLQKLLNSIDWETAFSNKVPENKIIFLEKKHFYNSFISLPVSLKNWRLPSGLINGQMIENTLSFYAWPAADINDFTKLPVPFMCIATDILTFKKADLKQGYLADAMRASIAIPSLITPIKIDSGLLLDGGMVRNFAASEVRDMGANVVIGSYVGFQRYSEEELGSVKGIMKQFGFARSIEDFDEQKKLVDVLIFPDLSDISALDFSNPDTLINRGYKAAYPYKEYFRKLADSLNEFCPQKPIENILNKQFYTIKKIEITGNRLNPDEQILGVLDIEPGDTINKYLLRDRIDLLYGKAWFEKVKYRIVPRNDSLILVIDCIEKPRAIVYGSPHYDNALQTGILFSISLKNLLTHRSVVDLDTYISQYYRVRLSALQYIDRNQKYGLSANFSIDNTLIPRFMIQNENIGVLSRNFITGLSFSNRLGLNNIISLSASYENLNLIPHQLNDVRLKYLSYNYLNLTYDYQINTLNAKYYPEYGMVFNFSAGFSDLLSAAVKTDTSRLVYRDSNQGSFKFDKFLTLSGNVKYFFGRNNGVTFGLYGNALLITYSYSTTSQNNFYLLGGIQSVNYRSVPMAGFHPNQVPVKKLARIASEMDWEISRNLHFNFIINVAAIQEANRYEGFSPIAGFGIGAGYMSLVGPLKAGLMKGFYDREKYFKGVKGYISLGYNF